MWTSLSQFFLAIDKVGSTIYLVCKYSLRTRWVVCVQNHHSMQKAAEKLGYNWRGFPLRYGWQRNGSWMLEEARSHGSCCGQDCFPRLRQITWLKFNDRVCWKLWTGEHHRVRKYSSMRHYKRTSLVSINLHLSSPVWPLCKIFYHHGLSHASAEHSGISEWKQVSVHLHHGDYEDHVPSLQF